MRWPCCRTIRARPITCCTECSTRRRANFRILRTALAPLAKELSPKLWAAFDAAPDNRKRNLAGRFPLADFDPQNAAGPTPPLASPATSSPKTCCSSGNGKKCCGRCKKSLVPPLAAIFADSTRPSGQRDLAIALLSDYAADDPDTLARLIVTANPQQYANLFPLLDKHRQRIVALMMQKLAEVTRPDWKDPPLNPAWKPVDPATVKQIEDAGGMLAERFAMRHSLPLTQFTVLAECCASGYRPTCFHPYQAGEQTLVAAIWMRGGEDWESVQDVSADEVKQQDVKLRQNGFRPRDVACYNVAPKSGGFEVRYAALWSGPTPNLHDAELAAEFDVGISGDSDFKDSAGSRGSRILPAHFGSIGAPTASRRSIARLAKAAATDRPRFADLRLWPRS